MCEVAPQGIETMCPVTYLSCDLGPAPPLMLADDLFDCRREATHDSFHMS